MPTRYLLTWRQNERRWVKKYKGKAHYFPAPEGKIASYQRCLGEWHRLKARIDAASSVEKERSAREAWAPYLECVRSFQQRIIDRYGDTDKTREVWQGLERNFVPIIESSIRCGELPDDLLDRFSWAVERDFELLTSLYSQAGAELARTLGFNTKSPKPPGIAPWQAGSTEKPTTVADLSKAFSLTIKSDVDPRRAKNLSRDLTAFVDSLPADTEIDEAMSSANLDRYLTSVKSSDAAPHTKRDKIAAVKQLATWSFEREYLGDMPRLIAAGKFKVEVGAKAVQCFEDAEVKSILRAAKSRERLYILIAINCGFTQIDISNLRPTEVDLEAGFITRKRSKTGDHESVPEVSRKLWPETLALLREHASDDPIRVLLNKLGRPLVEVTDSGEKVNRTDTIAKAMARLRKRMKRKAPITFKKFRATAASKLGEHPEFRPYCQYFLGHSPGTVADKHYVAPSQAQFDRATEWLREQFIKPGDQPTKNEPEN